MNLQKKILQDYREVFGQKTFREISDMTGIQQTRVFRLFNGSAMKLSEYEVFQQMIQFRQAKRPKLLQLLKSCELSLSERGLAEIEQVMDQKIRLWRAARGGHSVEQSNAA